MQPVLVSDPISCLQLDQPGSTWSKSSGLMRQNGPAHSRNSEQFACNRPGSSSSGTSRTKKHVTCRPPSLPVPRTNSRGNELVCRDHAARVYGDALSLGLTLRMMIRCRSSKIARTSAGQAQRAKKARCRHPQPLRDNFVVHPFRTRQDDPCRRVRQGRAPLTSVSSRTAG